VTFASGGTGTLKLDASSAYAGTVAGLALGNDLDLADIAFGHDGAGWRHGLRRGLQIEGRDRCMVLNP
jgi:hypothetical protein